MHFPEELLHFVWQFRLYGTKVLQTTAGEPIEVIQQGMLNKDAGPDFSKAKIRIGDTVWVGNVELHLKSSDWLLHNHRFDRAYDNVILHVVYEDNMHIYRSDGTVIPVLVIKDLFPAYLQDNYENLMMASHPFPCQPQIKHIDGFLVNGFLSRVLVERLEDKSNAVKEKLEELKNDWDEAFYHFMARNFGFKVNALPMELLARSLPQQLFAKHKDQPVQIEALIFGQAGFLQQNFKDDYPKQLQQEYRFLKAKYQLTPLDVSVWKFMRMRPQNFPTLRLAQFAALIVKSNHLFSKVLALKDWQNTRTLFEDLPVNAYWQTHYHFNKATTAKVRLQLGEKSIDNLLINTLSLFLFAFGKTMDQHRFITHSFYMLENIPAENNAIIQQYASAGVSIKDAYHSQALLQLKKTYCNEKKCLNCGIGIKILKQ